MKKAFSATKEGGIINTCLRYTLAVFKSFFSIRRGDFAAALIFIGLFLIIIPIYTYASYSPNLISRESLMNKKDAGIVLLDRNNVPFFTFYQGRHKTYLPLNEISEPAQKAIIAAEDRDFYAHNGFSIRGIIRSAIRNINEQNIQYGGSTITQQLIKNSLLNSQKNFLRKYQEIILAYEVERRFTKEEILEMYLNSVYFGEGAFGVDDAARTYFNKKAKDLTLEESTLLAGLLPSPSLYSPLAGDVQTIRARQHYVLQNMTELGFISSNEMERIENKVIILDHPDNLGNKEAVHFALMVKDELINKYGEEVVARSGFRIKTTLDLEKQRYAEEVVTRQVEKLAGNRVTNGAAVVMDPKTGEILALVGSRDWNYEKFGKVNVALSERQPGSSFKPIVYSAAFEKNLITPATLLQDRSTTYGGNYKPRNYDGGFRGAVTVRRALANSLNVPAVEVMNKVGVDDTLEMAERLGITTLNTPSDYGLSLVLGAGEIRLVELTSVYAVFANYGLRTEPTTIYEIRDKFDNLVYRHRAKPKQVLSPQIAFLISSILSDNNARRELFGNVLDISRPAAVKTGTTQNYRDSLTIGYTPSVAVGVWVGNNNGAPMDNIAGSLGAAPIWKSLMEKSFENTAIENFNPPEGDISLYVCQTTRPVKTKTKVKEKITKDGKEEEKELEKEETRQEVVRYREYFIAGSAPSHCKPDNSNSSSSVPETIIISSSPTP